ncbi:MAG: transglycosylase SLT domain-containing protein, partial [Deltaproteobacteria bacterium]|nr:transglycosylase SLT domain-containing protein [Deltaproteobacteria bacterium]
MQHSSLETILTPRTVRTKKAWPAMWSVALVLVLSLLWNGPVRGASVEPADFPSLVSSLKSIGPLDFCGEPVPLENLEVRERLEKEVLLYVWNRAQVILWLKRSTRYLPYIEKMLRENEMPEDLKYLPVVESALLPHIRSRKGAVGMWQFMAATGRKYGLTINSRIDERQNLFAATEAAIRYLKDLYAIFDSWALSAAAYNMGEDGLEAEISEQQTNDYYALYLPLETQRFLLRILAVKLILSDPGRFGFNFHEEDYYRPITFDEVQINCSRNIPIRIIAQAAGTHFKVIKDLNPELRGHYVPSGTHTILIPRGASEGFHNRFEDMVKAFVADWRSRVYVVRRGDTLSSIAEQFDMPLSAL